MSIMQDHAYRFNNSSFDIDSILQKKKELEAKLNMNKRWKELAEKTIYYNKLLRKNLPLKKKVHNFLVRLRIVGEKHNR